MTARICSVSECSKQHAARGYCRTHLTRFLKYGDADVRHKPGPVARPVRDRFWPNVDRSGECWVWGGLSDRRGYGRLYVGGRMAGAHRVSYEIHFGSIPDGLFVLHHCDNPPCVNPAHLFLGTHSDNMRDMAQKDRHWRPSISTTHCKRGHLYTPENTRPDARGLRSCRTCTNDLRRERRRLQKEAS